MAQAATADRLVTEAMRLFSRRGFDGTSVAQIEAAAGLAPGSGALYHHFKSKDALLEAGIDRQLDRRNAMRDIRKIFAGLGDVRVELTMMGRYVLAVIDDEEQLLQIVARTAADRSERLNRAYHALMRGLTAELAEWIQGWLPDDSPAADDIAAVALDALVGHRSSALFFHSPTTDLTDEQFIGEWTAQLEGRIQHLT